MDNKYSFIAMRQASNDLLQVPLFGLEKPNKQVEQ